MKTVWSSSFVRLIRENPPQRIFHNEGQQNIQQEWLARFFYFSILYSIFIFPIIRADYAYIDDKIRIISLYFGWKDNGRPLADLAISFVTWSKNALDVAPLFQILAIFLLAGASTITSLALKLERIAGLICVGFIVCNPFFLENLSYRYDSFFMSLAIFAAFLPFVGQTPRAWQALLVTFFAALISLNLYQPALNAFIIIALYVAILRIKEGDLRGGIRLLAARTLACVAALAVYQPLSQQFVGGHYALSGARTVKSILEIMENIYLFSNKVYIILIGSNYSFVLLAVILFGLISINIKIIFLSQYCGLFKKTISFSVILFLLFSMFLSVAGPMLFLANPILDQRVFVGFGALVACLASSIVSLSRHSIFYGVVRGLIGAVLAGQVILSFVYGNVLVAQGRYEAILGRQIVEDVFAVARHESRILVIRGEAPYAPTVRKTVERLPTVRSLVRVPLRGDWYWGGVLLSNHGLPESVRVAWSHSGLRDRQDIGALLQSPCGERIAVRRLDYDMFEAGEVLLLDFRLDCRS